MVRALMARRLVDEGEAMRSLRRVRRLFCGHQYSWSERRRLWVCGLCGATKPDELDAKSARPPQESDRAP